ncbi:MAG: bifunctional adenosylcobinamide kinase/adenosylcobinamide-phosphate guanylyltransferase [Rhodocyclaceae bacterium]|nr:bifunctional adenosylcobinamide kinase/adenosylcobinamide-phosphate guanylyltransferase [Rhodocyclaceae bacterium]
MPAHLILGGARSGKSRYAETLAAQSALPVTLIATAQALDAEMAQRIAHHRQHRPAHWQVIEEPIALAHTLRPLLCAPRLILIDCLSLWLANLLADWQPAAPDAPPAPPPAGLSQQTDALLELLPALPAHTQLLLVANEVGLGLVPETPLGRLYRDEAGRLNQRLAAQCERVSLLVAGLPLAIKGDASGAPA